METTISVRSSSLGLCSSRPSNLLAGSASPAPQFVRFGITSRLPRSINVQREIAQNPLVSRSKSGHLGRGKKRTLIRASSSSDSPGPAAPIAPLQLESPIGQFLSEILISHPHLVPAAVEQQLEQLQTDRDAQKQNGDPSSVVTDLVLYKRIAEVKANERSKVLQEILYALVVQKFMDADVSLIPSVSPSSADSYKRVDTWPSQDGKLELLHSPEALEMIQNHLNFMLRRPPSDMMSIAEMSKLMVGQVYAASVMYGYFLKRIDERFQLEMMMKILPQVVNDSIEQEVGGEMGRSISSGDSSFESAQTHPEVSSQSGGPSPGGFVNGMKASRLKTYVMSFDNETLQRYSTIRSKEAVSIIEKHTEALFGRPEIVITPQGEVDASKDERIKISFGGLRGLILEAVTFGSFLWDVESYVDSRYHFVAN